MTVKKKQILTATLMVALVAAVAVNWYYTRNDVVVKPDSSTQSNTSTASNLGDSLYVAGRVVEQGTIEETSETQTNIQSKETMSDEEYFASAKLKRDESNDSISDQIESLLENENLTAEDKTKITELLTLYQETLKAQTDTENLITAKLSCQCIVIIKDGTAQIILPSGILNETVLLQITDIFEKNTDISSENLTIIEAK